MLYGKSHVYKLKESKGRKRESFFQFKPLDETRTCMEKGSPRRIGFS